VATYYLLQNGMALIPRVSVAWQHAFGDVTPTAALSFQSIGSGFNILVFRLRATPRWSKRRRSAAHLAGQDRRLLCGPTRQQCARPFGQGQFHLAVSISACPRKRSPDLRTSPAASFWRTPPSRPSVSRRTRARL